MATSLPNPDRKPDYRRAISEAEQVLQENSVIAPPVRPKQIAESYGLRVLFVRFPQARRDVMGFVDFKENNIYVNQDDAPNRQTFTIAHELGHVRLHKSEFLVNPDLYRVLLRRPMGAAKDPFEQEANCFAANLLVPSRFLLQYSHIATDFELARLFTVSEDVIRFRLMNINAR